MRWWLVLSLLAGCGDNLPCDPPTAPIPSGAFNDPYMSALPNDCEPDGIARATGRWFMVNPKAPFDYYYPEITGGCGTGFRLLGADDSDTTDDFGVHVQNQTWSDGTLLLRRFAYEDPKSGLSQVTSAAMCLRSNGELAEAFVNSFPAVTRTQLAGKRFELPDGLADHLQLVGELGQDETGAPFASLDLAVEGDVAYLAGEGGFVTIDVHDPHTPKLLEKFVDGAFNDVVLVHGDDKVAAYLSPLGGRSTDVVDVTDPQSIQLAARIPAYSHTLTLRGTQLYLADYSQSIPIFDVTHPLAPVGAPPIKLPINGTGIHDMWIDGTTFYVNDTSTGFVVVDATDPTATTLLGSVPTSYSHTSTVGTVAGRRVILHGDEGWAGEQAAFLRILDGDPASPSFLAELARYSPDPRISIHNFQLVGDRLYIAHYQAGVRVVDLSDPTHPREVAHYNTWRGDTYGAAFEGALGIQVIGDLIYVADLERGLIILRDPALSSL